MKKKLLAGVTCLLQIVIASEASSMTTKIDNERIEAENKHKEFCSLEVSTSPQMKVGI